MNKLSLVAAGVAVLMTGAVQAQAHEGGYLPAPAYAHAGQDDGYADEGSDCGRDQFTIVGAHAGATVLGFNAGVGGHFGFGDGCKRHHHHHYAPAAQGYGAQGYAPPPPMAPYPAAYPQAPWGAPYAYRAYPQPGYAPPPPRPAYGEPCGVCARPDRW